MITAQITGKTGLYGIIGYPVAHSLSPVMQNAALEAAGVDACYVPFEVAPSHLETAIGGLRALGVCGWNVTIPHKTAIIPFLDELAESARQAGAVNTVVQRSGRLIGHNTDGDGLLRSLQVDLGCTVQGARVLLIGAGGAARGALVALCRAGAASVAVLNRSLESAELMVSTCCREFPAAQLAAYCLGATPEQVFLQADLIVNATSLGMHGEKITGIPLALMPAHVKVYDMVYTPPVTPLLEDAGLRGLAGVNGLGMLIAQGELAFALWQGREAPAGVMRHAVAACN